MLCLSVMKVLWIWRWGGGVGVGGAGSINWGGGGDAHDELQPLLAPVPPLSRSGQRSRHHHGLHISNDNTPAIVQLSSIRARLMRE